MKRPLVAVVVAYGIGLLLAQLFRPPLAVLLVLLLLILILIVALRKSRRFLIWPLLALLGWTNFSTRTSWIPPTDLRVLLNHSESADVTVRGTLAETPRVKISQYKGKQTPHNVVRVRVRELRRYNEFQPATGEILATVPGLLEPDFFGGQLVEISGAIAPPAPPLAEGLFDYQTYLATRGIYYELKTDSTNNWALREPRLVSPPLTDRFLRWSHETLAMGLPVQDEPLQLLWAMTLGWRTAFTGDIGDPFLRAGTMHMFAIDGLRIALLSAMIVTLLRLLRLSRAWCGLVAVPVIWFYTAATGWEASAVRASVMMTIVLGGWALRRPGDLLNSLAAAAFIILLIDPRQLFEASFQLSFCVMLVIALVLPPWNAFWDGMANRLLGADPLLLEELVPAWRKSLQSRAGWLARFCGLSFAAWLGSLPLAAKYFHLFSPVSTLANLFAVPLGAAALTANLGALICGHWLPWATILFNHAAWFLMLAMTWVSIQFARLPGAYFYVPEPSLVTMVIYYAALIAAFSGWFKTNGRKLVGLTILAVIGAVYFWQWQASRDETNLTVLPLAGGHAVYVDADGRRNDWLINCGSTNMADSTLKEYLRGQGVNSLPRLVLAEGNDRNSGGAKMTDDLFGLGELWTSGAHFRSLNYRRAVAAIEAGSRPPGSRHHILKFGDTNGCWQVLYPAATDRIATADDDPLVLLGDFRGTRILLLAELSRDGQSELLGLTNDLRADIVIAGLPEKGEPLCNDLIAAIQPRVMVIADSDEPATRRASRALRDRLEQTKIPVIYTRTARAVKIVTDQSGWKLRSMDGQEFGSGKSERAH